MVEFAGFRDAIFVGLSVGVKSSDVLAIRIVGRKDILDVRVRKVRRTTYVTGNPRSNFVGLPWSYASTTVKTERLENGKILRQNFSIFFHKIRPTVCLLRGCSAMAKVCVLMILIFFTIRFVTNMYKPLSLPKNHWGIAITTTIVGAPRTYVAMRLKWPRAATAASI